MKPLDESTDVLLMMEFRQQRWEEWVTFCKENGYKAEVRE